MFQSRFILFIQIPYEAGYNDFYCAGSPKWQTNFVKRLKKSWFSLKNMESSVIFKT